MIMSGTISDSRFLQTFAGMPLITKFYEFFLENNKNSNSPMDTHGATLSHRTMISNQYISTRRIKWSNIVHKKKKKNQ